MYNYDLVKPGFGKRGRLYRPRRYQANEILSPQAYCMVGIIRFSILNISVTGLLLELNGEAEDLGHLSVGQIHDIEILQNERRIIASQARIVRFDVAKKRNLLALSFEGEGIDLEAIKAQSVFHLGIDKFKNVKSNKLDFVPAEYKSLCGLFLSELRLFQAAATEIEAIEPEYREGKVFQELIQESKRAAITFWDAYNVKFNEIVLPLYDDKPVRHAVKTYTEKVLTSEFSISPIWRHMYRKPLGYPGDHNLFDLLNQPADYSGNNLYATILDELARHSFRYANFNIERISEILKFALNTRSHQETFSIFFVGAPTNIKPIIKAISASRFHGVVKLLVADQDRESLERVFEEARAYHEKPGAKFEVSLLNISFRDLLRPNEVSEHFECDYDFVLCEDLLSYLNPLLASRFIDRTFSMLRDDGYLYLSTPLASESGVLWAHEFLVDWSIYFRRLSELSCFRDKKKTGVEFVFVDERSKQIQYGCAKKKSDIAVPSETADPVFELIGNIEIDKEEDAERKIAGLIDEADRELNYASSLLKRTDEFLHHHKSDLAKRRESLQPRNSHD